MGRVKASHADEGRRADSLDGSREIAKRRVVLGEGPLVGLQLRAALHDQPLRVDEPAARTCVSLAHAFFAGRRDEQLSDAGTGLACAEEEELLLGELLASQSERAQQSGQGNACGALDVVVEAKYLVPVLFENSEGRTVAKVFELNQRPWEYHLDGAYELVDELVVFGAANALLPKPDVERIVGKLWIVRPHVEGDGQGVVGMQSGAGRV